MIARSPEDVLRPLNDVERRNAPKLLYLEGDVALLRAAPRMAVVGARQASPEALRRTARLARELVELGVTVVSGLALGVDTAAHEGTLAAGGRTVAVLGTPLDDVHPRQNRALQERIGREHLLVSQFAQGTPTVPSNFPRRNRTMALLCDATVIVEAGEGSGTLHQGWEALRLGRPLFLLRSLFDRTDLSWPAEMHAHGAVVLSGVEQLVDALALGAPEPDLLVAPF
ncbi:MAG TPA: DNA-processing protein DprA [Thermoanaerobaculia bacterium]|nr:DNA-processing protein DprA [Thermoanaerobaculia bacterium]